MRVCGFKRVCLTPLHVTTAVRCVTHTLLSSLCFSVAVILEKPIRIPRSLSVKAASVLKGFLNKVRR